MAQVAGGSTGRSQSSVSFAASRVYLPRFGRWPFTLACASALHCYVSSSRSRVPHNYSTTRPVPRPYATTRGRKGAILNYLIPLILALQHIDMPSATGSDCRLAAHDTARRTSSSTLCGSHPGMPIGVPRPSSSPVVVRLVRRQSSSSLSVAWLPAMCMWAARADRQSMLGT